MPSYAHIPLVHNTICGSAIGTTTSHRRSQHHPSSPTPLRLSPTLQSGVADVVDRWFVGEWWWWDYRWWVGECASSGRLRWDDGAIDGCSDW